MNKVEQVNKVLSRHKRVINSTQAIRVDANMAEQEADDQILLQSATVWIVILTFNNYSDTRECLRSLQSLAYSRYHIIVVDNGSNDGTSERVRVEFPDVIMLAIGQNLGVSAGYNIGFRYALQQGAEYVFMLNNDTVVDPNVLAYLMLAAKQAQAGIYVPIVYYYGDRKKVWSAGARYRLLPPAYVMETRVHSSKESYRELDFAIGCALLIHRRAFEQIGLWDENYFFNWEDLDFSVRIRRQNLRIVQVPDAKVWHKVSQTTRPTTSLFWEVHGESSAIFFRRHYEWPYVALAVHMSYFAFREFLLKRRLGYLKPFLRGVRRGLRHEMRNVPQIEHV